MPDGMRSPSGTQQLHSLYARLFVLPENLVSQTVINARRRALLQRLNVCNPSVSGMRRLACLVRLLHRVTGRDGFL